MSDKEVKDGPKLDNNKSPISARRAKKLLILSEYLSKQESKNNSRKVSRILKKGEQDRTNEDKETLAQNQEIVQRIGKNKERRKLTEQRVLETEENEEILQEKCEELARLIQQSKRIVIYTGAGISTAASIPDYRGPQGVWTLLQKGEQLVPQDLSDAEPTLTHMCITQLHKQGHVRHLVSQNCDGLHLRSGLPRRSLSEVHGNMYIEICHNCKPHREYIRLFDVTENTGVRRHHTGRLCHKCGGKLKDTIIHFGEKGGLKSPYRWKEAARAAEKCDLILCLGSSLKVLKKYGCLWCMDRLRKNRPNLVIVNLQWTPKDDSATLKINGKCDDVMEKVLNILGYPILEYSRETDPIFRLASTLSEHELQSTNKKVLEMPESMKRLRSSSVPCTPTQSDTDSQSSSSCSSTSGNSTETGDETLKSGNESKHQELNLNRIINKVKQQVTFEKKEDERKVNMEDIYLSKSQRICNEAKKAMQAKLTHTAEVFHSYTNPLSMSQSSNECKGHVDVNDVSDCGTERYITLNGESFLNDSKSLQPVPQYDPLKAGPFDPGPSHEEKLMHLHMLQIQLQALKEKQQILKQKELQTEQHPLLQYQEQHELIQQQELVLQHQKLHLKFQEQNRSQHQHLKQHQQLQQCQKNKVNQQQNVVAKPDMKPKLQKSLPHSEDSEQQKNLKDMHATIERGHVKPEGIKHEHKASPNSCKTLQKTITEGKVDKLKTDKGNVVKQEILDKLNKKISPKKTEIKTEIQLRQDSDEVMKHTKELMQKKIHQQCEEQKLNDKKKRIQQQRFETEKMEMKQQHENEQLRLHQSFVIQQQMCEQAGVDITKKDENLRVFLQQQQLLVIHQNSQVQDLFLKHQLEYKQLSEEISPKHCESTLKVQPLLIANSEKNTPTVQGSFSNNISTNNQLSYTDKVFGNSLKSELSKILPSTRAAYTMACHISPLTLTSPGEKPSSSSRNSLKRRNKSDKNLHSVSQTVLTSTLTEAVAQTCPEASKSLQPIFCSTSLSGLTDLKSPTAVKSLAASRSPGTDFSIASLMLPKSDQEIASESSVKIEENLPCVEKIPGFGELIDKITTCQSCQFLQNYGVTKRRCATCDDLKEKHGIAHGHSLVTTTLVPSTKDTHKTEPVETEMAEGSEHSKTPSQVSNDTKPKRSCTNKNEYSKLGNFDHNYLNKLECSERNVTDDNTLTSLKSPSKRSSGKTLPGLQTQISKTKVLSINTRVNSTSEEIEGNLLQKPDTDSQELSPVIPYVNIRVRNNVHVMPVISINDDISECSPPRSGSSANNMHTNGASVDLISNINSKTEVALPLATDERMISDNVCSTPLENINGTRFYLQTDSKKPGDLKVGNIGSESRERDSFRTGIRSHSQSEVYDANIDTTDQPQCEGRYVRSLSHNEILSASSVETTEGNKEKTLDGVEISGEDSSKVGKKRKLTRCASVSIPGWFGKGLNMKKRRKY